MKKLILFILIIIIVAGGYTAWNLFAPAVGSSGDKYLYIKTGTNLSALKNELSEKGIIPSKFFFEQVSSRAKFNEVKPGRYKIQPKMSLINFIRMLKAGRQEPVKLVINKLRTKEDFASKIGKNFELDSTAVIDYITSNDSLIKYGVDTNTLMTLIIPNTYSINWNGDVSKLITRFKKEHDAFWNKERLKKAENLNLSTEQVYTVASIVEEETNKQTDKELIASVYTNRINKGMRLEADPTVKYAMRNFGLKRILYGHLQYPSPYNTYRNTGLPPGPICTPSTNTIDAVLNQPKTNYIFFVAKPDFNGYSNFATNYEDHKKFAKQYQTALDSLILKKNNISGN